jgi:hypothetical protein
MTKIDDLTLRWNHALDLHKQRFFGSSMQLPSKVGDAIVSTIINQTTNPAQVYAVAWDEIGNAFTSLSFSLPINENAYPADRASVEKSVGDIISAYLVSDNGLLPSDISDTVRSSFKKVPAREMIDKFGLFDRPSTLAKQSVATLVGKLPAEHAEVMLEGVSSQKLLDAEVKRLVSESLTPFTDIRVHREALACLQYISDFDWSDIKYYSKEGTTGLLRRQAAQAYPLLAHWFSTNTSFGRQVIDKMVSVAPPLAEALNIDEKTLKKIRGAKYESFGLNEQEIVQTLPKFPIDWFPRNDEDWLSFSILMKTVGRKLVPLVAGSVSDPYGMLFKGVKGNWKEFHERCATAYTDSRPPQGLTEDQKDALKKIDIPRLKKTYAKDGEDAAMKICEAAAASMDIESDTLRAKVASWILSRVLPPDMSEHFMQLACENAIEMVHQFRDKVVLPAAGYAAVLSNLVEQPNLSERQITTALNAAVGLMWAPEFNKPEDGKSIPMIFESARYYVNDLHAINERIPNFSAAVNNMIEAFSAVPTDGWPRLFNGTLDVPGTNLYWEVLDSTPKLKDEGSRTTNSDGTEGLFHCVGGYTDHCRTKGQHIVSLRERANIISTTGERVASYRRLATLQILPVNQGHISTQQFYAIRDTEPAAYMHEAKAYLLMNLREGMVPINFEFIEGFQRHVSKNDALESLMDGIHGRCRYDYQDPKTIMAAMNSLGSVVHKLVAKRVRSVKELVLDPLMSDTVLSFDLSAKLGMRR